jgi:hypothetical protein
MDFISVYCVMVVHGKYIMSGGPSRGTMALEAETAPRRAHRFRYGTCFTAAFCRKNIQILFE